MPLNGGNLCKGIYLLLLRTKINVMKIKEITDCLETVAPLSFQEQYDNAGLLTGHPDTEVTGILVTLDVTPGVIAEAIQNNCNLVISHHPMVFSALKKFSGNQPDQQMVVQAIKNDIAVYAIHTNLDNASMGLNRFLAEKLGMVRCRILQPKEDFLAKLVTFCPLSFAEKIRQALFAAGAGHIGNYDKCSYNLSGHGTFRASEDSNPFVGTKNQLHTEEETRIEVIFPLYLKDRLIGTLLKAHPYEEPAYDIYPLKNAWSGSGSGLIGELPADENEQEFLARVKAVTGIPVIRHSAFTGKPIRKIAICTGSGSFLIQNAMADRADIFLTADIKYHEFFDPQQRMILADIGHYESEQFVKELISSVLIENFPKFAVLISKIDTNPVNYF
jgi:dinuclear metal center YbgI/SA1388 family protein